MQATITYLLTEQAQRAQMAATGQPVARKQTMAIEVSAEDLTLLPLSSDGTIAIDISGYNPPGQFAKALNLAGWVAWNGGTGTSATVIDPPFLTDLRKGLALIEQQKRAAAEELNANGEHNRKVTEAAYQRFLDNPADRIDYNWIQKYIGYADLRSPSDWWPVAHEDFKAEINRRNEADAADKKAAEAAKEKAKADYITAWIAKHGDPETQEQFRDGLLPRDEALSLIANAAFDSFHVPAEWEPEYCDNRNCPCGPKSDIEALPRSVYPAWRAIKASLPEGYKAKFETLREHVEDPDDGEETAGDKQYAALVTLPVGPFQFSRLVRLGSAWGL